MKHQSSLYLLATALILSLTVLPGCGNSPQNRQGGSGSSPSSGASSPEPPISITAVALAAAYEENEVTADEKYKGKNLIITGKVEGIYVLIKADEEPKLVKLKGKEISTVNVNCTVDDSVDDSQKSAVARLKKGQQVTVQGTCDGISSDVEIKDCVIK